MREPLGNGQQRAVSHQMTVAIVDPLKAVEIDEQHRESISAVFLRALNRIRQAALEQPAVRQAGQRIMVRAAAEARDTSLTRKRRQFLGTTQSSHSSTVQIVAG